MFLSPNLKSTGGKNKNETQEITSFDENKYLPPHLLPKSRSMKIRTYSKAKSPLSKTQTSFSSVYKPQHIQGKTFKLPAVSDILNMTPK